MACGLRYRTRLLAPVGGDAALTAALAGTIAVGIAGTLFNDSGPVLLLFATFLAACLVLYVRGDPRLAGSVPPAHEASAAVPVPETAQNAELASPFPDPAPTAR